jgi:leucyl aminopeptidase
MTASQTPQAAAPTTVTFVREGGPGDMSLTPEAAAWASAHGFSGQRGKLLALPGQGGLLASYLFGTGAGTDHAAASAGLLGQALPDGAYLLDGDIGDPTGAAIGFRLGAYRFNTYRQGKPAPRLVLSQEADADEVDRIVAGAAMARDLINTPANDLGPDALHAFVTAFAADRDMALSVITGDALESGFPMIHAVGRASTQAPRLLDLRWGDPSHPLVTLVGKGVTFDTGGLDIKSSSGMLLMKKDMGGAANVIGLAHAIVSAGLRLRLRVLLPVVENAIASNAFRPGDVLRSRKGLTVEIGNTDAEGRLILADALALADEERPELLVDMATLTGAARTALGPDLPPLYSTDEALARDLAAQGLASDDPLWPMPLWSPYDAMINSRIADINNAGSSPFAGSITAALFLRRFVENAAAWVHLDIYGWAPEARGSRTYGGTDQGIRALYAYLKRRYPAQ